MMVDRQKLGYDLVKKEKKPNERPSLYDELETMKSQDREKKLNFQRY